MSIKTRMKWIAVSSNHLQVNFMDHKYHHLSFTFMNCSLPFWWFDFFLLFVFIAFVNQFVATVKKSIELLNILSYVLTSTFCDLFGVFFFLFYFIAIIMFIWFLFSLCTVLLSTGFSHGEFIFYVWEIVITIIVKIIIKNNFMTPSRTRHRLVTFKHMDLIHK